MSTPAQPTTPHKQGKKYIARPWLIAVTATLLLAIGFFAMYYGTGAVVKNKAGSVYYLEAYDAAGNFLGTGSGFLINNGYDIVTCFHVIEDAQVVFAVSADEQEDVMIESVKAYNPSTDLIILHSSEQFKAHPLVLADSDSVRQGDKTYAIGYPLGLSNTLSDGIVSARYLDGGLDTLQITAAISPGSSGGALLNTRGQVIGVTSAYYADGQNMNIAIASNAVKNLNDRKGGYKSLSSVSN